VFSGGIGEHAPEVRARIFAGMECCSLVLETERNSTAVGREARLTPNRARLAAYMIQVDEERVIAEDVVERLTRTGDSR
jgi:acetate kinase